MPTTRSTVDDGAKPTLHQGGNITPIPDPTEQTTTQLLREIQWIRELFQVRFEGYDRAISLLQANADKSPTIAELFAKHEEKFASIQIQFIEKDARALQTSEAAKTAVTAALQAAKERFDESNKSFSDAISKSEIVMTKQVEQLATLSQSSATNADGKIGDLKDRMTAMENRALVVGILCFMVGIAGIVVAAIVIFQRK
jgi:hypothetical protein